MSWDGDGRECILHLGGETPFRASTWKTEKLINSIFLSVDEAVICD
jgi:hypothetical protein